MVLVAKKASDWAKVPSRSDARGRSHLAYGMLRTALQGSRQTRSMSNESPESSCPDFAYVVRAALAVSSSSQGPGVRRQFLRDLDCVRKNRISKIDILDMEVVFRDALSPMLGVGTASGDGRSLRAAEQVVQATGSRCAANALIVVAFAPGDMRNGEGRMAARPIYQRMETDCFVCVGVIEDEHLAHGMIRVSALIG